MLLGSLPVLCSRAFAQFHLFRLEHSLVLVFPFLWAPGPPNPCAFAAVQAALDELLLQQKRTTEADPGSSLLPVSFQASSSLSKEPAQEALDRGAPQSP